MYKAQISLMILSIGGSWRPIVWHCFAAVFLYNIFSIVMALLVYSLDTSLYMYIFLQSLSNTDDFAEALCWFLLIFTVCVKLTNLLIQRDEIIKLIEMFEVDYFLPRDSVEEIIQKNYDSLAR